VDEAQAALEERQMQAEIAQSRDSNQARLREAIEAGDPERAAEVIHDPLGVDVASKDAEGLTVREVAERSGLSSIAELLTIPGPLAPLENKGAVHLSRDEDGDTHVYYWLNGRPPADKWLRMLNEELNGIGFRSRETMGRDSRDGSPPPTWSKYLETGSLRMVHFWKNEWHHADGRVVSVYLGYKDRSSASAKAGVPPQRDARGEQEDDERIAVTTSLKKS